MAVCNWKLDKEGLAPGNSLSPGEVCDPPEGFKGFVIGSEIVDEHGHKLDGDWDPKGRNGCQHTDTPEWKAAHNQHLKVRRKEKVMADHAEVPVPVSVPVPTPAPEAPATVASVGAPDLVGQVQQLMPKDGNATAVTAVMAALVVVGGLLYKLGPNLLKARNEREMKKLELEEKKLEKQDDQHQQCNAARLQLDAKITELSGKVEALAAKAEKLSSSSSTLAFGEDFDAEEFVDWREQVDKALKLKTAKKGKKLED
jgi:hypothetical protein